MIRPNNKKNDNRLIVINEDGSIVINQLPVKADTDTASAIMNLITAVISFIKCLFY